MNLIQTGVPIANVFNGLFSPEMPPPKGGYIYLTPLGVDGSKRFGIFWERQHLTTAADKVI